MDMTGASHLTDCTADICCKLDKLISPKTQGSDRKKLVYTKSVLTYLITRLEAAVNDLQKGDYTPVLVVPRVKEQGFEGSVANGGGWWHSLHNGGKNFRNVEARFAYMDMT
jgi:hypothetical protein